jgi:transglutaminase-like putative cysteine protease
MNRARSSIRLPFAAAAATLLAAICLGEIFLSARWFVPAAFAVILVIATCELARRNSIPRSLVPLVGAGALVVYLVERYARAEATLGFVPNISTLQRLVELTEQGNTDISRYAAPIGVLPGVELITVAGIGLVALTVDTLAVTARRAALAGLPLLALYTVPAALAPDGVSWQAFALAGAGYLGLMLTEARERVTRWGRPMRYSPRTDWRDEVQTAPLAQLGRRVGAAALGIALIVPAVVPEISLGSIGFGEGGFGQGNGVGRRVSVINPIIDLGRDLRQGENKQILRYEGTPTYLRMVGLDLFDGETWKPSRLRVPDEQTLENGLPRPPGLDPGFESRRKTHVIEVGDLDQQWLPLPYPARRVTIEGRWLYDTPTFNVFSLNTSTRDKSYRVVSRGVQPTADELRAAPVSSGVSSVARYLRHPLDIPSVILDAAEEVTADAPTAYDKALALQSWLRSPAEFTYSTQVPQAVGDLNGSDAIAAFLEARRGYCVHFASAMALMARLLNIPARVAVGFTPGTRDGNGGYVVGLHDAHSWPELYFEGVGWVPFEPTPQARTGAPPAWAQPEPEQSNESTAPSGSPSPSSSPSSTFNQDRTGIDDQAQGGANDDRPLWQRLRLPLVPTLIMLGLLVLAMVPGLTRRAVRRRRWRRAASPADKVAVAWTELQDTLLDFGFRWHDSDSPRRGAQRATLELELPVQAGQAVGRLARAIEQLRYAPEMASVVGDLRNDVACVDSALAAASRRRRARARLLPASTRMVAAAVSERLADGLDALDSGAARLRARLVPRPRRTG